MLKSELGGESVKLDRLKWHPLPVGFVSGHVMWKLLHVSPEEDRGRLCFRPQKPPCSQATFIAGQASTV